MLVCRVCWQARAGVHCRQAVGSTNKAHLKCSLSRDAGHAPTEIRSSGRCHTAALQAALPHSYAARLACTTPPANTQKHSYCIPLAVPLSAPSTHVSLNTLSTHYFSKGLACTWGVPNSLGLLTHDDVVQGLSADHIVLHICAVALVALCGLDREVPWGKGDAHHMIGMHT